MIGVFGGTFDPVHAGHLRCAIDLLEILSFEEIRFIPARIPPHRDQPVASEEDRYRMVCLALEGQDRMQADRIELERPGPSYMVDTLAALSEATNSSLVLMLGTDAFAGLDRWHEWERIFDYAHLVVMQRPVQQVLSGTMGKVLSERLTDVPADLETGAGKIFRSDVTLLDISASEIRQRLAAGRDVRYLLPDAVLSYIQDRKIYTSQGD